MSETKKIKVAYGPRLANRTQIASIFVCEQLEEWRIPTDLLCYHSAYFCGALRGESAEAKEQRVELRDADPAAFRTIIECLYTHDISENPEETPEERDASFGHLFDVWVLADYLQIPSLQRTAMQLMGNQISMDRRVPVKEFQRVFANYDQSSPVRRWMVQSCVWALPFQDDLIQTCADICATEMLGDICLMLSKVAPAANRPFPLDYPYPLDYEGEVEKMP
ncbi:hypothetical protein VF21_09685 [Pseudogymnoascus sp. 05NY08]|nr:hypothetical protein VF21_09685 [Pseudogymnoascus sp. 05NY08]